MRNAVSLTGQQRAVFAPSRCMAAGMLHSLRRIQPIYGLRSFIQSQNAVCVEPRRCAFATAGDHLGDGDGSGNVSHTPKGRDSVAAKHNGGATQGAIDLRPPRGTRDFNPEAMRLQAWLFGHWEEVTEQFGFEMVDYPVLESESLFIRKAGEEITEQLYNFEDKGGRRVALRPELTPSLARLVLADGASRPRPLKWAAIGQCWRYERSTRGRRREHYQWNMDVVGVQGVEAEAELLAALVTFFKRVGLTSADVGIKISTRALLGAILTGHGVDSGLFPPVYVIVDKAEKLPVEAVIMQLEQLGLNAAAVESLLQVLSLKDIAQLCDALPGSLDNGLPSYIQDLQRLFQLMDAYGLADWVQFDASVVRGLAYYTGTVFEAFDRGGALRAICGGGRYDNLLSTLGGGSAAQPCTGFGFGDAVIIELLRDRRLLPELPQRVDDVVFAMEPTLHPVACQAAAALRGVGRRVDLVLEPKRLKWALRHAERLGARELVLVAPEEWARGELRIKTLETREEVTVRGVDELIRAVSSR